MRYLLDVLGISTTPPGYRKVKHGGITYLIKNLDSFSNPRSIHETNIRKEEVIFKDPTL